MSDRTTPHPGAIPDRLSDKIQLPFGVDEDGNTISWHLGGATAHALIIGPTGTGRTMLIRSLALTAAAADVEVIAVDPKRIELSGLRDYPGVTYVATEPDDMARAIDRVYDEMNRRAEAVEGGEVTVDELRPILFIVDEYLFLCGCLGHLWRQTPGARGEHPALAQMRRLASGGRSVKIHLCIGAPRRDVLWLGGVMPSQFGFRVDLTAPSRCIAYPPATGGTEIQWWKVPDPNPRTLDQLPADDQELLARLRPDPTSLSPAVLGDLALAREPVDA
jgi:DNA segregation ATPase FtsK/SpoIIIE, S-DNA-T family